jgi:hypothetical protein
MSETATDAGIDALDRLRELAKRPRGTQLPDRLHVKEIKQVPEVFQPRGERLDRGHVLTLKKAAQANGGVLDAVLVIQLAGSADLVDGHHRLAAYEAAGITDPVPVVYFDGGLQEATLEAGKANSKAKLPMTAQERRNYAWRLTLMGPANKGGVSKKQIREASSVSDGLLGEMRRVSGKLGAAAADYKDWWTAMKAAKGEDVGTWSNEDREDWERQRADDLTDK